MDLTISAGGEVQAVDHDLVLDFGWNPDNLHVVAWVQRDSDRFIWNAGRDADETSEAPVETSGHEILALRLWQNSPNPARGATTIRFAVPQSGPVEIAVFDAMGREVARPLDREIPAGSHALLWNGSRDGGESLPNGVYLYRLRAGGRETSQTLVLHR